MIIEDIIREQQPEVHRKLSSGKRRRRRRKRKDKYKNYEHLSFNDIARMMHNNNGVDERECNDR